MATLTITLPDEELENLEKVAEFRGIALDQYIRGLMTDARKRDVKAALDAELLRRMDSPGIPAGKKFWDDLKREVIVERESRK
ncbi:MAG TPA: hypothetical protein VGJ05_22365 [Fimbriiglobus sp.]|jgi:hypothetical protein